MTTKKLNILIADDDVGDRMIIKRALRKAGISSNIYEASNVDQVLHICEEDFMDCAILDYRMPGKSGLEGIKLLYEKFPFLAIIMVTGQGDELLASRAFKVGATDYIPKSAIDVKSIKQIVFNAIEKSELKKKVEEQNQEHKLFSYVLAHDLNSPIQSIQSLISLLKITIEQNDHDEIEKILNYIETSGNHLSQLIKELSAYNSVQTAEINIGQVSMTNVLEKVKSNLKSNIENNDAKITYDKLPEVQGNETFLIQLMQNLIQNGIKYCKSPIPHVHIYSEVISSKECICVSDNGIGISNSDLNKIFEPFKRLVKKNEFKGTGLGLATCKKIIERHNGKIWCESEIGKGSVFRFLLNEDK